MANGVTVVGAVRQELGTNAANDAGVRTATTLLSLGRGPISFVFVGRELAVADVTNNFVERIGLIDGDGAPVDGVYFRYNYNVNGGEWEAVTVDASSETATDTNVLYAAGTNRTFKIEINAAGTEALYYIDGTLVRTETGANLPDATDYPGFGWSATRSAGTAADINPMALDYIRGRLVFTTPRC